MMLPVNLLHQAKKKALMGNTSSVVYYKLLTGSILLPSISLASPTGGQVIDGAANIQQQGSNTTINQTSQQVDIQWNGFDVASGETVRFNQPNSQSLAVNRILDTNGTQIHGQIQANGQVWLINPNGVLFGQNAQINVGALTASALNPDGPIGGSSQTFSGSGEVFNQGQITANGGYVALLGSKVVNEGSIQANQGTVALGAGSQVSLHFNNNGQLTDLTVDQSELDALVENRQAIIADGGQVLMSAGARNSLLASQVNNSGLVQARTVSNKEGHIILLAGMEAGTTEVAGTLDASAPVSGDGGFIETSGAKVKVSEHAKITTLANQGNTGTWLIDPKDYVIASSGGDITGDDLGDQLDNTNVTIESVNGVGGSEGNVIVNDGISWTGTTALTLVADKDIQINKAISASQGKLHLRYAQANSSGNYFINKSSGGKVTLSEGLNLTIKKGSDSAIVYQVITSFDNAPPGQKDLLDINSNLNSHYAIGTNIIATSNWNPFDHGFSGALEGLGNSISNISIISSSSNSGFFSTTTSSASISHLSLENLSFTGNNTDESGGLVGDNSGVIRNVYVDGNISLSSSSSLAGGIAGVNKGSIKGSIFNGSIKGGGGIGGLVGHNTIDSIIESSESRGSVEASSLNTGGLVGFNQGNIITSNSSSQVTNTRNHPTDPNSTVNTDVGGLVGDNTATGVIKDSYATGNVTSKTEALGGLTGNNRGSISNSYSNNTVTNNNSSENIGGLSGLNSGTVTASHSYSIVSASSSSFIGGLIGLNEATAEITSSYSRGTITTTGDYVGGLVGNNEGKINGSYSTSNVQADITSSDFVGGLVGSNSGELKHNYATGEVIGHNDVGGLVGINSGGTIKQSYSSNSKVEGHFRLGGLVGTHEVGAASGLIEYSYSTSNIEADNINGAGGGLVGHNQSIIRNSYSTGTLNSNGLKRGSLAGRNLTGGSITNSFSLAQGSFSIIGEDTNPSASNAELSAAQLKDLSSYTSWGSDISNSGGEANIWRIYSGSTTPLLRHFLTELDLADSQYTYNGGAQQLEIKNAGVDFSKISGTASSETNAGHYASNFYSNQQGYDISGQFYIAPQIVNISGSKTYDGSNSVNSNNVSLDNSSINIVGSGNVATADVTTNAQTLTLGSFSLANGSDLASNYTLVGGNHSFTINSRVINVSASRSYDGTTSFNSGALEANNAVTGETLNFTGTASVNSTDANSNSQVLDVTQVNLADGSGKASNYTLIGGSHNAFIQTKKLITSGSRSYDGSLTVSASDLSLEGLVAGEILSLTGTATTTSKDVGTYRLAAHSLSLNDSTNAKASNYQLSTDLLDHQFTITPLLVTPIATAVNFIGQQVAELTSLTASGFIAGDEVSLNYDSSNFQTLASGVELQVEGIQLAGAQASNYQLSSDNFTQQLVIAARENNPGTSENRPDRVINELLTPGDFTRAPIQPDSLFYELEDLGFRMPPLVDDELFSRRN